MAQQQSQWGTELRIWSETTEGNVKPSAGHTMDRIAEAIGKVNNIHTVFAFYDIETGKRLRKYGPFGDATPELMKIADVDLGLEEEEKSA